MNSNDLGYGFHPNEEEVISYLNQKMLEPNSSQHFISTIDVCRHEPWELPGLSNPITRTTRSLWYFFSSPHYKSANSTRTNRMTQTGYWKITSSDRDVRAIDSNEIIGIKKTLVFYDRRFGNSKKGVRTNWAMQEFHSKAAHRYQNPFVLCRVKLRPDDGGEG